MPLAPTHHIQNTLYCDRDSIKATLSVGVWCIFDFWLVQIIIQEHNHGLSAGLMSLNHCDKIGRLLSQQACISMCDKHRNSSGKLKIIVFIPEKFRRADLWRKKKWRERRQRGFRKIVQLYFHWWMPFLPFDSFSLSTVSFLPVSLPWSLGTSL